MEIGNTEAKQDPTKANFIPDEALRQSENLRNPQRINREITPKEVSASSQFDDQDTEANISPDQPTIAEAKHEVPDTRVKGG